MSGRRDEYLKLQHVRLLPILKTKVATLKNPLIIKNVHDWIKPIQKIRTLFIWQMTHDAAVLFSSFEASKKYEKSVYAFLPYDITKLIARVQSFKT